MLLLLLISSGAADGPNTPRIAEGFYRRKTKPIVRLAAKQIQPATTQIEPTRVEHSSAGYHASAQTDRSAQIDTEIGRLMHASMERDDEEALLTLLTALEY